MLFDLIPKEIYSNISEYAKILIPSLFTGIVTRYTLNKPKKYAIAEKQFEFVYLPLYLLTKQLSDSSDFEQCLLQYIKKVEKIVYKNYPLVYPKTLCLLEKLKNASHQKQFNYFHLDNFKYQIDFDYERLKRKLGYPTNSFIETFKHLNKLDKLFFLFYSFFLLWGIGNAVVSISLFFDGNRQDFVLHLFISATCLFMFYVLYWVRR